MTRRLTAAAAAAAFAALALAGCAGDGGPDGEAIGEPTAVTEITDLPGSVENYEGALADATTTACERRGDAWSVAGTVANSAAEPRQYRIYVSLLKEGDTRGVQQVDVAELAPGASAEWSTSIPVAEDGLECVLRVERFAPGAGAAPAATESPEATPGEEAPAEEQPAEGGEDGEG